MKLKPYMVRQLMDRYAKGNYNEFARQLGVDPSQLWKSIVKEKCGGKKLIGAVIRFCTAKGLNFEDYIEL